MGQDAGHVAAVAGRIPGARLLERGAAGDFSANQALSQQFLRRPQKDGEVRQVRQALPAPLVKQQVVALNQQDLLVNGKACGNDVVQDARVGGPRPRCVAPCVEKRRAQPLHVKGLWRALSAAHANLTSVLVNKRVRAQVRVGVVKAIHAHGLQRRRLGRAPAEPLHKGRKRALARPGRGGQHHHKALASLFLQLRPAPKQGEKNALHVLLPVAGHEPKSVDRQFCFHCL